MKQPTVRSMRANSIAPPGSMLEIFGAALRLGLTSFGGPVAHLGYFRRDYVERRHWIDEEEYADLVALCQFLPGPASSQVGMAVGLKRGGLLGAVAAWLGFTLPSAVALTLVAGIIHSGVAGAAPAIHGLLVLAVAVVAQAVWGMARTLASDRARGTLAILAAFAALLWTAPFAQIVIIAVAGLVGWRLLPMPSSSASSPHHAVSGLGRRTAAVALALFLALLLALPLLARITESHAVGIVAAFYRVGALVFGGGHVVLPLLQREVVPTGWVSQGDFLAGYGAAQAVPGPLFTFAAYLGAVAHPTPNGPLGAALATCAIFLPSILLIVGVLPFWEALRRSAQIQSALRGVNASVVGILLAALYHPVWTSAIRAPIDAALALLAFGLLTLWTAPPWLAVLVTVALSWLLRA